MMSIITGNARGTKTEHDRHVCTICKAPHELPTNAIIHKGGLCYNAKLPVGSTLAANASDKCMRKSTIHWAEHIKRQADIVWYIGGGSRGKCTNDYNVLKAIWYGTAVAKCATSSGAHNWGGLYPGKADMWATVEVLRAHQRHGANGQAIGAT